MPIISGSIGQPDNAIVSGGVNCGEILNVSYYVVACEGDVREEMILPELVISGVRAMVKILSC